MEKRASPRSRTSTPSSRGSTSSSTSCRTGERSTPNERKPVSQKTIEVSTTTETADVQFELEKARFQKKREMKTKQLDKYAAAMYGSPKDKEELRREQREGLLTQIRQKEESTKFTLKEKVKESETAVAFDKQCIEKDKQEQMKKAKYLTQFRDGNKQLIEMRAEERRRQRDEENRRERELLKQNPLNWSNTLS